MTSRSLRCANSARPARAFVQLAKRRYISISSPACTSTNAPLDFLIPRGACPPPLPTALRACDALPNTFSWAPRPIRTTQNLRRLPISSFRPRRHLSTTPVRCATTCVRNPRTDEDGNGMMLEITPRAAKRLSEIMAKDKNPNLALRIQVESGGCHGFQYLMSLITLPSTDAADTSSSSPLLNEDDSIFEYAADDADAASSSSSKASPRIILDEASLDLLKGSKVDFTMELIGSQFKIVDNPYAVSSCGCGTSFDIKM